MTLASGHDGPPRSGSPGIRVLGQFGCAPGTEGTERAEFTTEERSERGTKRRRGCGSTRPGGRDAGRGRRPKWRGSRRAQVAHNPHPLARVAPLVTRPRSARSRPRRLRLLRFVFVLSVPPLRAPLSSPAPARVRPSGVPHGAGTIAIRPVGVRDPVIERGQLCGHQWADGEHARAAL